MNAQQIDVRSVLQRTSEGLHGIADGCRNPELAGAMRDRAREFDAAVAIFGELLGAADEVIKADALSADEIKALARLIRAVAAARGTAPPSAPAAEESLAREDARLRGVGFLVDGRRVDPDRIAVIIDGQRCSAASLAATVDGQAPEGGAR